MNNNLLNIFLVFQNVDVQLFHDLHNEVEALHEAVDGDAEHAVRGSFVMDPEDRRGSVIAGGRAFFDGKRASDKRRQLPIYGERLVGYGSQARGRERDVDNSAGGFCVSGMPSFFF